MSEYITVFVILALIIVGWLALCIDAQGVKEGLKMAIGLPIMIVVVLSAFIWVGYSLDQVFGSLL